MFTKIAFIAILLLAVALNSNAQDSGRVDKLERELQEIQLRLSKLEALLTGPSNDQKPVTSGEGWKSIASWRKLTTDMSASDVRQILGEPARVDGGNVAFWYYSNRGTVNFISGKVSGWTEPRQ